MICQAHAALRRTCRRPFFVSRRHLVSRRDLIFSRLRERLPHCLKFPFEVCDLARHALLRVRGTLRRARLGHATVLLTDRGPELLILLSERP